MNNLNLAIAIAVKRLLFLSLMIFAISCVGILMATHMLSTGIQYRANVPFLTVCGYIFICVFCLFGFVSTMLLDEVARHGRTST